MRHPLGKVQVDLLLAMRLGERVSARELARSTARGAVPSHSQLMSVTRALRSLHARGFVQCWCARRHGEGAWEVIGSAIPAGHWIYEWELTPAGYDEAEWIRSEGEKR